MVQNAVGNYGSANWISDGAWLSTLQVDLSALPPGEVLAGLLFLVNPREDLGQGPATDSCAGFSHQPSSMETTSCVRERVRRSSYAQSTSGPQIIPSMAFTAPGRTRTACR